MRILLTTDTVGGVWTFTRELSLGLLDAGHSVVLVSFGRDPDADQQSWAENTFTRFDRRFAYHANTSPLEWMQDNAEAFRHSAPVLERLAKTFHADLIHANQFCFGALATCIPVLITAHSDVMSWAEACHSEALAESPWLTRYKSLVQHGLSCAAAVTAPTRWMLQALAANFTLPIQRVVIPNGRTLDYLFSDKRDQPRVPHDHQSEAEVIVGVIPSTNKRKLQAVTAGRLWDEAKNLTLLTELKSPIPLVIAGELAPNVPENMAFTGHLSEQALLQLFTNSAIYVCTSKYEPFGLAPLEAALCGCAVLANDIPTLREVWQDAALYFTGAHSLEALLTQLAAEPEQLAFAQQRSYQRAVCFSRSRMTTAYLDCYHQILKAGQEPAHAA